MQNERPGDAAATANRGSIRDADSAGERASNGARDRLYADTRPTVDEFTFDQAVVDVFPDMLSRSIPGYRSIIAQSGLLAARHVQPQTRLYDLGCSLGATSVAMREALDRHATDHPDAGDGASRIAGCRIHAVDNSRAMIERCRTLFADMPAGRSTPVVLQCADLETVELHDASVVAMNFTLQFIAPAKRATLMRRIVAALRPGGALILSEKLAFDDPVEHALHTGMHHAFKRANGYSDLEISQKRTALENVMIPDTLHCHHDRLADAGFSRSSVWFQCFNFASLIAIR